MSAAAIAAQVTASEFIAALLPPTPASPALGDPCVLVSSPFVPKGEETRQWPPVAYHAGASYGAELYVNWALCRVVEYTDRSGTVRQAPKATNAAFAGQYFLMLDDIGNAAKSSLTPDDPRVRAATYLLETSEGNFQVGYAFAEPLNATESAQLRAALAAARLGDAGALKSAHRWCRVPGSVNMKPGRQGWKSVLRSWHPERVYTFGQLCRLLDIVIDPEVQAPAGSTAEMPADIDKYNDAHFRWLRTLPKGAAGSIIEPRRSTGFFPIVCPWHEEHTHGKDGAAYRPGFGDSPPAFHCHHEHAGRRISTGEFLDWCIGQQRGGEAPKKSAPPADEFWNFHEVSSGAYPDWLIGEMFARRQVGAIYGESYTGKSVLANGIALALAGGADVLGDLDQWEADVGAVYFALEGNLRTRTEPYIRTGKLTHEPRIRYERALRISVDAERTIACDFLHERVAQAKEFDPRLALVVVDTLARASMVDENSADLGLIAEAMRIIAEEYDVCVLIVHHSGKDQSKGLRGHSSFYAALDFAIEVQVEKDQTGRVLRRTFSVVKQREGEGQFVREFEISGVEIGRHPKRPKHAVSGPIVQVRSGEAKRATAKPTAPKGKNQKIVYDTLKGMLLKASRHPEAKCTLQGWGVPTAVLCDGAAPKLPVKPGHDRRRERVMETLVSLSGDGWVWFVEGNPQYVIMPHYTENQ
jgi:KaiC/GvpD/RAD55 family RecA-like ATPase